MTNIQTIFGHQNILNIFWMTFLISNGLWIGQVLGNVRILVSTTLCSGGEMLGGIGTQSSTYVAFARNFVNAPRSIT